MLKKETINRLVNEYKGDNLGEYLSNIFEELKQIVTSISFVNRQIAIVNDNCKLQLKKWNDVLTHTQSKCLHLETTYYGDPSGGSDSCTICNICGKEL